MAAVSIPPSPQAFSMMSNRRVPLAHVPNAANSPFRAVAAAASKRSHGSVQRELSYGQPPPAKKQMVGRDESSLRTPPRRPPTHDPEGKVFTRKTAGAPPTAFERRLVAARDRQAQHQKAARHEKVVIENLENIRQWQRHYRKAFPQFVFYFDSVPDDARNRLAKQIAALGAREEKFFSKDVTHIITTRPTPSESDATTSRSSTSMGSQPQDQLRTINPLLLDKSAETVQTHEWSFPAKSKFTFEAPVSRKHQPHAHAGGDTRKQQGSNVDILLRGREMGMKIWALEKLQRMMTTMFDTTLQQHAHGHAHPPRDTAADTARNTRANLFQMLQNERLNGPSDRDSTVATKELVPFKGPYIYIRDMDEKTRPIMVRQYQKVAHRDDGTWPQFRSASRWRCPFVEDTPLTKQEAEREEARERYNLARIEKQSRAAQRAQIAATAAGTKMQSSKQEGQNDPLNVCQGNGERTLKPGEAAAGEPFRVPRYVPSKRGSPEKAGKILSATYPRHRPYVVNEPIASGVQPSNITSAIRSQMISSTAAAPGLKAGTSREVHELKRKVLEKNSGPAANRVPHLSRMADLANGTRSAQMMRTTNGKGQEKLRYIDEEFTPSEEEENARLAANSKKSVDARQKKPQKKDAKPGYCENCQEKFDDFEKHTVSRKHRKFAFNDENFADLDALLQHLVRPLRRG